MASYRSIWLHIFTTIFTFIFSFKFNYRVFSWSKFIVNKYYGWLSAFDTEHVTKAHRARNLRRSAPIIVYGWWSSSAFNNGNRCVLVKVQIIDTIYRRAFIRKSQLLIILYVFLTYIIKIKFTSSLHPGIL